MSTLFHFGGLWGLLEWKYANKGRGIPAGRKLAFLGSGLTLSLTCLFSILTAWIGREGLYESAFQSCERPLLVQSEATWTATVNDNSAFLKEK